MGPNNQLAQMFRVKRALFRKLNAEEKPGLVIMPCVNCARPCLMPTLIQRKLSGSIVNRIEFTADCTSFTAKEISNAYDEQI